MARKTTQAEIRASILDMRRIYAEKTDEQFAFWYQRRYRVPASSVLQVIQEQVKKA
ncbi:hypothetical protein [Paenibacillus senegalimassiliensis]|uniref:hypothetical protein n=1 Tax=Paenibacillus senegalimassiliensis TaxID=1737426 RepID=UPI0012FDE584|nr:hypothetical protein [Paenibacillus senegalimassiliensis]